MAPEEAMGRQPWVFSCGTIRGGEVCPCSGEESAGYRDFKGDPFLSISKEIECQAAREKFMPAPGPAHDLAVNIRVKYT
jgi:hypothetical protein